MLFQFTESSDLSNWYILDDGVMGGMSKGNFEIGDQGQGIFSGKISLENYGGFSSLRYRCPTIVVSPENKLVFKLKGDGKIYQIRVKAYEADQHSYISYIETTHNWEEIVVNLNEMYPSFRGRKLRIPNFNHTQIEEVSILFGNKKEETFKIEIDNIQIL